ncbi:hypothetical protein SCUCBS95973_002941 [Sporothrix curviconia]|uniref:2EXR domain-containing protein n=1 Tax=Sporothrix curviconia TaxID=1260050 RepID=A0ABP0BCA6_9PEZI
MGALQDPPVAFVTALEPTGIGQGGQQSLDAADEAAAAVAASPQASPPSPPSPPSSARPLALTAFHKFNDLPTELRLKIWQCSFVPRVVEVHRRKSHYADDHASRDYTASSAKWQSWSANPPALAVCYEARALALAHYTASIRLAVNTPCERAGEVRLDAHRRLYLAPHVDTLVVLGEFHVAQTAELLKHIQAQAQAHARGQQQARRRSSSSSSGTSSSSASSSNTENQNSHDVRGLRRLALSASSIGHPGSGILLQIYGRNIFKDLDTLVLVLYNARTPPSTWRDGHMALVDCRDTYQYRYFRAGQGAELRAKRDGSGGESPGPTGWMTVGRGPLEVLDLAFGKDAETTAAATATKMARARSTDDKRGQPHVQSSMAAPLSSAVLNLQDRMAWITLGR